MKKSSQIFNNVILVIGILSLLYYVGMGLAVRFGQSLLFLWALLGIFCIGRYLLWKRAWNKGKALPLPRFMIITLRVLIVLALLFFLFAQALILPAAYQAPEPGLDAIVVLGARVNEDSRPSGSLYERISAARTYLEANPDALCIASGGQGSDEPMSEAECIASYLRAAGIVPERILLEERSTSTVENLKYSFALLPEGCEKVGIVTNDFHVYRAVMTGKTLSSLELSGISARSSVFGFIHYDVREVCALAFSWVTGQLPIKGTVP